MCCPALCCPPLWCPPPMCCPPALCCPPLWCRARCVAHHPFLWKAPRVHTLCRRLCQTILNTDEYCSTHTIHNTIPYTITYFGQIQIEKLPTHTHTCTWGMVTEPQIILDAVVKSAKNAWCVTEVYHCCALEVQRCALCVFLNRAAVHSPSERVADNVFGWDRSYFTLTPSTASKCPFVTFIK